MRRRATGGSKLPFNMATAGVSIILKKHFDKKDRLPLSRETEFFCPTMNDSVSPRHQPNSAAARIRQMPSKLRQALSNVTSASVLDSSSRCTRPASAAALTMAVSASRLSISDSIRVPGS
jgi:hypothetical protein